MPAPANSFTVDFFSGPTTGTLTVPPLSVAKAAVPPDSRSARRGLRRVSRSVRRRDVVGRHADLGRAHVAADTGNLAGERGTRADRVGLVPAGDVHHHGPLRALHRVIGHGDVAARVLAGDMRGVHPVGVQVRARRGPAGVTLPAGVVVAGQRAYVDGQRVTGADIVRGQVPWGLGDRGALQIVAVDARVSGVDGVQRGEVFLPDRGGLGVADR